MKDIATLLGMILLLILFGVPLCGVYRHFSEWEMKSSTTVTARVGSGGYSRTYENGQLTSDKVDANAKYTLPIRAVSVSVGEQIDVVQADSNQQPVIFSDRIASFAKTGQTGNSIRGISWESSTVFGVKYGSLKYSRSYDSAYHLRNEAANVGLFSASKSYTKSGTLDKLTLGAGANFDVGLIDLTLKKTWTFQRKRPVRVDKGDLQRALEGFNRNRIGGFKSSRQFEALCSKEIKEKPNYVALACASKAFAVKNPVVCFSQGLTLSR